MATTEQRYEWFVEGFKALEQRLNGESKSAIHAIRKNAVNRFVGVGFPTTRDEEWRFTNIAPIRNTRFQPALAPVRAGLTENDFNSHWVTGEDGIRLAFVNGHFVQEFSSVPVEVNGLIVGNLARFIGQNDEGVLQHLAQYASIDANPFVALSTAYMLDGAYVRVHDGASIDKPIEFLFLTSGAEQPLIISPRNLVILGRNARATIVETYVCVDDAVCLDNAVTEIVVGEGSVLEHDKLEMESNRAFHVGTTSVRQAAGSKYTNTSVSLGGKIVRNSVTVTLADERAEATLNGLSLATGEQIIDNHTTIDHTMPNCASHELYKSILDGRSRGVFNGKIFVRQDAQKTDAKQTNKTLLLSDDATINTKPQLEIFADDVKCTHGAAVGQLDEEQIFYLRSRGIGERSARDILTLAFANDVVERVRTESLRQRLHDFIRGQLERGRTGGSGQ